MNHSRSTFILLASLLFTTLSTDLFACAVSFVVGFVGFVIGQPFDFLPASFLEDVNRLPVLVFDSDKLAFTTDRWHGRIPLR